jgi:hypothetical protein
MAGTDTAVVLCTALSQQPCLTYEESGGKVIHRPRDFERLLEFSGVPAPHRVAPVMAEEFHVYLESEPAAIEAERLLGALRVGDRPALAIRRDGAGLFCGCKLHGALDRSATVSARAGGRTPFFDLFYQVEGVKSGMHHPEGMLWIRAPGRPHVVHRPRLPLTEVFPLLLGLLGLAAPRRQRAPEISNVPRVDVVARTV